MTNADFAAAVLTYCQRFGASVTSWIRTANHNAHVGGLANSAHIRGLGLDVVYDHIPDHHQATREAGALGLALSREKDHDHLQPLDYPAP